MGERGLITRKVEPVLSKIGKYTKLALQAICNKYRQRCQSETNPFAVHHRQTPASASILTTNSDAMSFRSVDTESR